MTIASACSVSLLFAPTVQSRAHVPDLAWVEQTNERGEHFLRFEGMQDGQKVTFDLYPQVDQENRITGYRVVAAVDIGDKTYRKQATIKRAADSVNFRVKGYTMKGKLLLNELIPIGPADLGGRRAAAALANCDTCDDVGNILGIACGLLGPGQAACVVFGSAAQLYYCMGERAICGTTGDVYDADFPCQGASHIGTLVSQAKAVRWKDPVAVIGAGWTAGKLLEGWWYDSLQWELPLVLPSGAKWTSTTGATGNWTAQLGVQYYGAPNTIVAQGWATICVRSGGGSGPPSSYRGGNTVRTCVFVFSKPFEAGSAQPLAPQWCSGRALS